MIQTVSLTWNKKTRGAQFAEERSQFPMVYPIEPITQNQEVVVYPLKFIQTEYGIVSYETWMEQILRRDLPAMGFSAAEIETRISKEQSQRKKWKGYNSIQEVNLPNLSIQPYQNQFEVNFHYDRFQSGMPFRRGHNKDYHNPQSPLYGQDCLNETAFLLKENQYGRVMWNERKREGETGDWYYQFHMYHLFFSTTQKINSALFTSCSPAYDYRQLAVLY